MSTRRVAITGASGFIGSALVSRFLGLGAEVRAVGHTPSPPVAPRPELPDGAAYAGVDVRDAAGVRDVLSGHDLVVHAAAVSPPAGPEYMTHVNVEGTRNVVRACRDGGVDRLVFISSTAAVGSSGDSNAASDENTTFNLELVPYSAGKRLAELIVAEEAGPGVQIVVANPGFVFGPFGERYRGSEVIARVLNASVVPCTNGGLSVVHIDDVVDGVVRVAERGRPGERYILSGENHTFRSIAETVCDVAGVRRRIVTVPDPVRAVVGLIRGAAARLRGRTPDVTFDRQLAFPFYSSSKAGSELGYRFRPFAEIVADYLTFTRSREARGSER